MKIIFFLPRQHPNISGLFEFLEEENISVTSVVNFIYHVEDHSIISPIVIKKSIITKMLELLFKNKRNKFLISNLRDLHNLIYDKDIIVLRNQSIILSMCILIIAKLNKKKIIIYSQGSKFKFCTNKLSKIKIFLLNYFFKAIYITPILGEKKIKSDKVFYFPFFLKKTLLNQKFNKENHEYTLTMIGKFQKRKNHKFLIDLVKVLNKEIKVKAIIIGSRPPQKENDNLESIREYINKLKINNIFIHNAIDNIKVNEILKGSHFFILPSIDEPAAFSPYEALSNGNILFINKENIMNHNLKRFNCIEEINIDSTKDAAQKIIKIIKHKDLESEMQNSKRQVLKINSIYRRYLKKLLVHAT